jgi:hypothetical protein
MDALHRSAHGSRNFVTPSSNSSVQLFIPYSSTSFVDNHFYHIPDCQSSDTSDVKASGCDVISEAVASLRKEFTCTLPVFKPFLFSFQPLTLQHHLLINPFFINFPFAKSQILLM